MTAFDFVRTKVRAAEGKSLSFPTLCAAYLAAGGYQTMHALVTCIVNGGWQISDDFEIANAEAISTPDIASASLWEGGYQAIYLLHLNGYSIALDFINTSRREYTESTVKLLANAARMRSILAYVAATYDCDAHDAKLIHDVLEATK